MSSEMSPDDWSNYLSEGKDTYSNLKGPFGDGKPKTKSHKYLGKIGRGTPKAQFFLTENGIAGEFGFWCPRSAIVSDDGMYVNVAEWCNITVIEYNR